MHGIRRGSREALSLSHHTLSYLLYDILPSNGIRDLSIYIPSQIYRCTVRKFNRLRYWSSMWWKFWPFPSIWLNFTSHWALHQRHQSHTAKSAKTFRAVHMVKENLRTRREFSQHGRMMLIIIFDQQPLLYILDLFSPKIFQKPYSLTRVNHFYNVHRTLHQEAELSDPRPFLTGSDF